MNERYGKYTAPSGKTRKSAASAKPKRSDSGGRGASATKKKPASAASKRSGMAIHPPTPEYKRWRKIWWVLLGGAIVMSTLAWWLWQTPEFRTIGNWILGAGYSMIFGAIFIDWTKLRPLRLEWASRGDHGKSDKAAKAGKSDES